MNKDEFNLIDDFKNFLNNTEHLLEIVIVTFIIVNLMSHVRFIIALFIIIPLELVVLYVSARIIDVFGGIYKVLGSWLRMLIALCIYIFICCSMATIVDCINTDILHLKPIHHIDNKMYDDDHIPGSPF